MAYRHIALGDGQQAGQARLGGQQVVKAGVQLLLRDPVAKVEQVALAVVQKAELGRPGQLVALQGQCPQALAGAARGRRGCRAWRRFVAGFPGRQFQAGLGHGQQVAAEVAAVHGGHIHRQQSCAGLRVVPVQEVAPVTLHRGQRGQRGLQARDQLFGAYPPERPGAGRAQQVQADIGRRGAVRHHVVRRHLQVVGWQVLVLGAHAALEQAPGVACDVLQISPVGDGQGGVPGRRARPADPPCPHWRGPPQQAQGQRQGRAWRMHCQQAAQQQQRHCRQPPVLAHQRAQSRHRTRLRRGGRGPLQQVAPAHGHAVEGPRDGVQRQQGLCHQLRHQPQATPHGAGQVDCRLVVEITLGQVVAAGRKAGHRAHQRPG